MTLRHGAYYRVRDSTFVRRDTAFVSTENLRFRHDDFRCDGKKFQVMGCH
jgi:hypothetical protein